MSATPPPGKLPPLQPPTLQQRHLRQQEQTPFQLRCNQTPFRDTDDWDTNSREGNKEHFGKTRFKRKSKNRSPCRPGRYVGTAEFSFFSQMGGAHPWLWIPAHRIVSGVEEGSAALPTPGPLPRKILESAIPKFNPSLEANTE